MLDIRYKDKAYLSRYDLDINLFSEFDLVVDDVIPVRKVFILNSDKGNKVLKKISCTEEELEFINCGIEHIKLNNFTRIIQFEKTKQRNICLHWNDELYCIMNLVEGRECEYNNPVDVALASRALANLHVASKGIMRDEEFVKILAKNPSRYLCGKAIESFNERLKEIVFFKEMVALYENKSEFDYIFLQHEKHYEGNIMQSIKGLKQSEYHKICKEDGRVAFCHHDLAHHNILIDKEEVHFLDFDYSIVDLRIHDICNFINKVIKEFAYDIEKCHSILREYSNISPLDQREIQVLYEMLSFPEDFYSIVRDYYTRKKQWSEDVFLSKLKRKIGYEKDREEFLSAFKDYYKC